MKKYYSIFVTAIITTIAVLNAPFLLMASSEQEGDSAAEKDPMEFMLTIGVFVGLFLVLYFVMIRPQQKQKKLLQMKVESIRRGDRILSTGGLYMTVISVRDHLIKARLSGNVNVELNKNFVANVVGSDEDSSSAETQPQEGPNLNK